MPDVTTPTVVGDLADLAPSFLRHLRAKNRSPKTLKAYGDAADQLVAFLTSVGMPTAATSVRREHVEAFIADLLSRRSASTAATRYRALQQFFKWLEEEGEVTASPMARMHPPTIPESPVPVLSEAELKRLLAACEGKEMRLMVESFEQVGYTGVQSLEVSMTVCADGTTGNAIVRALACPV